MERGGVRSKWAEKGSEVVKKAESAGELVKKGRASRQMGRWSIPGQDEQTGTTSRNDTSGSATRPFMDPAVQGGGDGPKRCRHPNRVL